MMKHNRIFILFWIIFLLAGSIWLTNISNYYLDHDFFTFWLGGRLASEKLNVYDPNIWIPGHALFHSTWVENPFFVYPLYTAIFTIPFGILNINIACIFWLFLSGIAITIGIYLSITGVRQENPQIFLIPFTLLAFLFRPTLLTLFTGQIDGFLFLFLALTIYLLRNNHENLASIGLVLLCLKPNLGIPIFGMFLLYEIFKQKWQQVFVLITGLLLLILIPVVFVNPNWIIDYALVAFHKSNDMNLFPTIRGFVGLFSQGITTTILWISLSALLLVSFIVFTWKKRLSISPSKFLSITLLITLLVTPYLRDYDLMFLLIPFFFIIQTISNKNNSFIQTNLIFLLWDVLSYGFLALALVLGHDIFSIFLTIIILIGTILAYPYTSPPHAGQPT